MRVEKLRCEERGTRRRIAADFVWENCEREPQTIYFEVDAEFASNLAPDPHPFLLAGAVPAHRAGETRIAIEGEVCPRLRDGLRASLPILANWFGPTRRSPRIEPSRGFAPPRPAEPARAAILLSGGIDSLAALRANRLDYSLEHPSALRDALFVDGFDINRPGASDENEFFARASDSLRRVARCAKVELIPIRTHLRELDRDPEAWVNEWCGSAAAAVAHVFSGRIRRVHLAGGLDVHTLIPNGSHPLIDRHYSSSALDVHHDGLHQTRLEKVRLVADWEPMRNCIRVCWAGLRPGGPLNCGRCHKCVLTMLELLAVGRLRDCAAFADDDVSVEWTDALRVTTASSIGFYEELPNPLRAVGREDLALAVEAKLAAYAKLQRWIRRGAFLRRGRPRSRRAVRVKAARLSRNHSTS